MPHTLPPPHDPAHDRDAETVAHIVALIHARRKGDYLAAADAHRELSRLGVTVRFARATAKGGQRDDR